MFPRLRSDGRFAACRLAGRAPGAQALRSAYVDAHDKAYGANARLDAFKALAECEEALTRALALLEHAPDSHGAERHVEDVRAYRMKFVRDRLTTQALQGPEAARQPDVQNLEVLDLGAFAGRAYIAR